jgi:surface protein
MRRGLFESVWLGSQAFSEATALNANIGAWNTARMTDMSYVCALCHRLCVGRVRLGVGCGAAWPVCCRPRPIEPCVLSAVLHSFFCASLISLEYTLQYESSLRARG